MINKNIVKRFKKIVGSDRASDAIEDRICYSYDATGKEFLPDIVIKPNNVEEISQIAAIANVEGIPIIPRGAGTGFAGGSLPVQGGIVLALAGMRKIISIDRNDFFAVVEPGVITGNLQKEVEKSGLFYPPDPASLKMCTIGGNAAVCAGGPRAVKYGVTKDYILGLEVVLADGRIMNTGGKTLKGVVGYDLTKLLVGSEGTLGIITKIILKLIPLPPAIRTAAISFPKVDDAAKAVVDILNSRIVPSCLEFMDMWAIKCVEEYLDSGLLCSGESALLIEIDGEDGYVDSQMEKVVQICKKNNAADTSMAVNEEEREKLWHARRSISPAIGRLNKIKINEDIAVPRSKLPEIIRRIHKIAKKYNLTIINFGHAGDGNIHVNIMLEKNNAEEVTCGECAVREVFAETLNLEGTISGEHGVGVAKMPYAGDDIGETGVDIMRKIKKVLDPNSIMNPGKLFFDKP